MNGANATLETDADYGANISAYFKAGLANIIVTGVGVANKYQLQDEANKLLTSSDNTTSVDTDNGDGIAFTAPAANTTYHLHFEAQSYDVSFNGNNPVYGTNDNSYPYTSNSTLKLASNAAPSTTPSANAPEGGVSTVKQSVKYNVEGTLNSYIDNADQKLYNIFALEGWSFNGWTTDYENYGLTEGVYTDGAAYTLTTPGNMTVYAQWAAAPYQIVAMYAEDWYETLAPAELSVGQNYTSTTLIKDYNSTNYAYRTYAKCGDTTVNGTVNDSAKTVSFTWEAIKAAGIEPGSTLTVYVEKQVAGVTVETYPLANNVVLVRAYSPSNAKLKWYDNDMLYDGRFAEVSGKKSNVMLLDVTMDGIDATTMSGISEAILASEKFSANTWVENKDEIAVIGNTPDIAAANFDVNGSGSKDISDITLVYNVYKGTYAYSTSTARGGMLNKHAMQYYLSDVTFADSTLDFTAEAVSSTAASATLYSDTNGSKQLVNMDDVKEEYTAVYTGL